MCPQYTATGRRANRIPDQSVVYNNIVSLVKSTFSSHTMVNVWMATLGTSDIYKHISAHKCRICMKRSKILAPEAFLVSTCSPTIMTVIFESYLSPYEEQKRRNKLAKMQSQRWLGFFSYMQIFVYRDCCVFLAIIMYQVANWITKAALARISVFCFLDDQMLSDDSW